MIDIPIHTVETAPKNSQASLEALQRSRGTISNIFGVMANSPALLNGYIALIEQLFRNGLLSPAEQALVLLTASAEHGCQYCVPTYSLNAPKMGLSEDIVKAVRNGEPIEDPQLAVLSETTRKLIRHRGQISENDARAFFTQGYEAGHLLEVLGGIALKTITNYLTQFSNVPLDQSLKDYVWIA